MAKAEVTSLSVQSGSLDELIGIAKKVLNFARAHRVWALDGEIGVGKTTFIKAIGEVVGISEMVNSPTFSIVNEYKNESGQTYYHFDFYRIKNEDEARQIGAEEYFYSGDYCFIEWSSLITSLLPDTYMKIDMQILDSDKRLINCTKHV